MLNHLIYLGHGFVEYVKEIFRSRRLILDLTRREFRGRYLGSAFGLIWAFIHPAMLMGIYWIVFQYGLKQGPVKGVPFVINLFAALVPWFFASESLSSGSTVVIDNRFLVKKVVFRVSLLPVVRLLSLVPVHLFFVLGIILMFWGYGFQPGPQILQIFYYLGAMMVLEMGLSWLISAMVPFLKDLAQVVQIVVLFFFWLTPIVWPADNIPDSKRWILSLNPLYYIVRGYRDSLIDHVWFWNHPAATLYYWSVTAFFFVVGGIVFLRLRSHFADVL